MIWIEAEAADGIEMKRSPALQPLHLEPARRGPPDVTSRGVLKERVR